MLVMPRPLWIPPRRLALPNPLQAMATAGKRVMLPSGKRGVLSSGKRAIFDASGNCAECCEECPAEITLTLSGIDAALCCPPVIANYLLDPADVDGVYTLVNDGNGIDVLGNCRFDYSDGPHGYKKTFEVDCSIVDTSYTATRGYRVDYNPSTGKVKSVRVSMGGTTWSPALGFDEVSFSANGTFDLAASISNQLTVCQNGQSTPGGTATVTL
jgi:hypothetical protein